MLQNEVYYYLEYEGDISPVVIQIIGDENVARQALLEVLSRLRCNAFGMELDDYLKSGGGLGGVFSVLVYLFHLASCRWCIQCFHGFVLRTNTDT